MRMLAAMATLALALVGCGGDSESALQGIYTMASWTHNRVSCDVEGEATFESQRYSHFFVRHDNFFGQKIVVMVLCNDLEECRAQAADTDTLFLSGYLFESGNDGAGWQMQTTSLSGENCDGLVNDLLLTGEPETSVRIETRSRAVTNIPEDSDGFCDSDAAYDQAESASCSELEVISGTFLESI